MAARRGQKPAGKSQPSKPVARTSPGAAVPQVPSTLHHASAAGYLHGRKSERIGGRVSPRLLSAAMDKSGLRSQAELLEYALAKVALEDDYAAKLLAMKGSVADDVDL
jgi:hypothetical protein